MASLDSQFNQALSNIEINGNKARRAARAQTEIRAVLEGDRQLREWGVDTTLIGSYARDTGIYPGNDVDVFSKMTDLETNATPKDVYNGVWTVLKREYGDARDGGRAEEQDRSVKVAFPEEGDGVANASFSVDAVPAVHDGAHWAIPTKDRSRWAASAGRWVTTDPEHFAEISSALSTSPSSPVVGGRNAYKPIVKLMRQARETHLGDRRPGGLYIEFITFEVWSSGLVQGNDWATLLGRTLRRAADRLASASYSPLLDPVLGTPVAPPLTDVEIANAATAFAALARLGEEALTLGECRAALNWRTILGGNDRVDQVFPLPPGCDASGNRIGLVSIGAGSLREARGFG